MSLYMYIKWSFILNFCIICIGRRGGAVDDSNYLIQLHKFYSTLNFEMHQHDCGKKTPNTHLFIVIKHLYRKVGREVVFLFWYGNTLLHVISWAFKLPCSPVHSILTLLNRTSIRPVLAAHKSIKLLWRNYIW